MMKSVKRDIAFKEFPLIIAIAKEHNFSMTTRKKHVIWFQQIK